MCVFFFFCLQEGATAEPWSRLHTARFTVVSAVPDGTYIRTLFFFFLCGEGGEMGPGVRHRSPSCFDSVPARGYRNTPPTPLTYVLDPAAESKHDIKQAAPGWTLQKRGAVSTNIATVG